MSSIQESTRNSIEESPNNTSNSNKNDAYTNDSSDEVVENFTGDLEKDAEPQDLSIPPSSSDPVPRGGDEMTRYELHAETSRSLLRRVTNADVIIKDANNTDQPMPVMGGGRAFPPPLPDRDQYTVLFDGPADPTHPQNWPFKRKIVGAVCAVFAALCLTAGSAIMSQTGPILEEKWHVGEVTITLTTTLYVVGFATGPIFFGPLSELLGRKSVILPSVFGYTVFSFAVATAKDLQTVMICRFFIGFVGGAPLVVSPAILADLFATKQRGTAVSLFAVALFGGPMLAPIFSGFIVKNRHMGWRWTEYVCGIIGGLSLAINAFLLEETHHGLILVKKAETLRRRTGNWGIVAPHEEVKLSLKEIAEKNISRPIVMLVTEPILFFITCYNAFIYAMLYLFLTAIPLVFGGKYHFRQGVRELPYLGMLVGILVAGGVMIFFERRYAKAMDKNGGKPVPEERLPPMMIGGFFFAGGLFWLGWSGNYPHHVHFMVPTVATSFVGFGLLLVFLPCLNYIIDCYLVLAASALAANTFMRSLLAGVFPLFSVQMFHNLHIQWACTLLGCLSLVMVPVPFLFYAFGRRFRERSKYAFVL